MLSVRYLAGILVVVFAASLGWLVLGGTIGMRTAQSHSAQRAALAGLWGTEQEQRQPSFTATVEDGAKSWTSDLAVWSSRIDVDLALDLRRKGLLWYNTYDVAFAGTYRIPNDGSSIQLAFALPAEGATYDDVAVSADGNPLNVNSSGGKLYASMQLTGRFRWSERFAERAVTVPTA